MGTLTMACARKTRESKILQMALLSTESTRARGSGRREYVHDRKRSGSYEHSGACFQDGARNGLYSGQVGLHLSVVQGRSAPGSLVDDWPLDELRRSDAFTDQKGAGALDQQRRCSP